MPFNCHFYLYNLSVVIFYISQCITSPALWTTANLQEQQGQDPLDIMTDFSYQMGYIIRVCVSAVTIVVQFYILALWLAVARRSTSKLQLLMTGVPLLIMFVLEFIQAMYEPLYYLMLAGDSLSYISMLLMWGVTFHGVQKVGRSHLQLRLFLRVQLFLHMVFSVIQLLCCITVVSNATYRETGAMYLVRQPVVDPTPRRPSFAQPLAHLSTPSPFRSLQLATLQAYLTEIVVLFELLHSAIESFMHAGKDEGTFIVSKRERRGHSEEQVHATEELLLEDNEDEQ